MPRSLSQSILSRKQLQRNNIQNGTGWVDPNRLSSQSVIFAMPHEIYGEVYLIDFWPDSNAGLWTANARHATIVELTETYKHLPKYLTEFRSRVIPKSARGLLSNTVVSNNANAVKL